MSQGPRRARGRRRAGRGDLEPSAAMPSVAEVAVYTGLAAVVAAGLLIASGHPWWHGVAVLAGAAALVGAIALVAKRSRPRPGRRRRG